MTDAVPPDPAFPGAAYDEAAKHALIDGLARAGLIQFGYFPQPEGDAWPVWVNLRMLVSYPALLRDTARLLAPLVGSARDERLLCTVEAIPLAVALSLQIDRPLVIPFGADRAYTSAFVFEGAYDVGHPTALVADVLLDAPQARALAALADRVGLVVTRVVAVLDLGLGARAELDAAGLVTETVLALDAALPRLAAGGWLSGEMARTVSAWMTGKS